MEAPVAKFQFPVVLVKRPLTSGEALSLNRRGIKLNTRTRAEEAQVQEEHARAAGRAGVQAAVRGRGENRIVDGGEKLVDNARDTSLAQVVPDLIEGGYVLTDVHIFEKEGARCDLVLVFQVKDATPAPVPFEFPSGTKEDIQEFLRDSGYVHVWDNTRTSDEKPGNVTVQIARPDGSRRPRGYLRYVAGDFEVNAT